MVIFHIIRGIPRAVPAMDSRRNRLWCHLKPSPPRSHTYDRHQVWGSLPSMLCGCRLSKGILASQVPPPLASGPAPVRSRTPGREAPSRLGCVKRVPKRGRQNSGRCQDVGMRAAAPGPTVSPSLSLRTAKASWRRRAGSATMSISTIFRRVTVRPSTTSSGTRWMPRLCRRGTPHR
jgi:hypothetical protein